ncbi:MAG: prolyl oligopeptidase family serine peptidase [Burkholderiales bacterium]|jgi:prolyl oligopeptidase|nr:prolyl oligopeptidase family serine peptidase [Nitrosomonadaceae bacterium]
MKTSLFIGMLTLAATTATTTLAANAKEDPYLWLEEVMGEKSISWVKEQNAKSQKELEARPEFAPIRDRLLAIVNSRERIPGVQKRGEWYYNFWQDAKNIRGVWRRTTLEEYRKAAPNWEVVLDLDQLARDEKENWVWRGANCRFPDYNQCMISLSRGGADAVVVREWDLKTRSFVKGGFELKEAKGSVDWIDADTLFVQQAFAADLIPNTQTKSGYARQVRVWKRGTPITAAKVVFEGQVEDIGVSGSQTEQKGYPTEQYIRRGVTFFTSETYWVDRKNGDKLVKLDIPADATFGFWRDWLSVRVKTDWTVGGKTYKQGSLIAMPLAKFLQGERNFDVLFEGTDRTSLSSFTATKDFVILNVLDNVKNRLYELSYQQGKWVRRAVTMPGIGTVGVGAVDADDSNDYWMTLTDYLTPSTLFLAKAGSDTRERLKSLPAFFDAAPYKVEQLEVASKDGERIPYFVIMGKNAKLDGKNPTLLYGYGGFEISQLPAYSGGIGAGWLDQGGVYVVANIRGGGEFGPRWHQAGLKANRQRVFDDFIAVAQDLVTRKITSPRHLAISGGSNGGLLVGAVMVQRPDLFRAVICSVPLLDMQRYHKLLAGASWVAEYGNPDDPKEWEFISKYSPYQNVKAGVKMPRVLFVTSTRDDRVHPGHARKMMARMMEQGHNVLYYENIEGGHSASANNQQLAYRQALQWAFLLGELK